jgi:predicted RNase H-like HicB family nuclease
VFCGHRRPFSGVPCRTLADAVQGAIISPMKTFTLEYWQDEGWYVGRLKEVAGVMSQGETLAELEANIREAYQLMQDTEPAPSGFTVQTRQIDV